MPQWLADVNSRTRTPVKAIVTSAVLTLIALMLLLQVEAFLTFLAYTVILALFFWASTALAGILLPYRLPDVYRSSAARWEIAGIPLEPMSLKLWHGTDPDALIVLGLSIATLVIGFPFAYYLARYAKHKTFLLLLVIVPFWTSFLIRTYSWLIMLDPDFPVFRALRPLGFLLSTFVFLLAIFAYLRAARWWRSRRGSRTTVITTGTPIRARSWRRLPRRFWSASSTAC
jgi:amino acid transporter